MQIDVPRSRDGDDRRCRGFLACRGLFDDRWVFGLLRD